MREGLIEFYTQLGMVVIVIILLLYTLIIAIEILYVPEAVR